MALPPSADTGADVEPRNRNMGCLPMRSDIARDAHAVLFPAFADIGLDEHIEAHLRGGGVAVLLGETREEYVARGMSSERKATESATSLKSFTDLVRKTAGTDVDVDVDVDVVVAVDQELGGIERLAALIPKLPSLEQALVMPDSELEAACQRTAAAAKALGVNLFLAPIVDVVTAMPHPWLAGRTLGSDAAIVGRIATAYVRGVQAGGVAAMAKHFPGFPALTADPAISPARLAGDKTVLEPSLSVFRAVARDDVAAIMLGPAIVDAIDPSRAASISPAVVAFLRSEVGYDGLIVTDDLDSRATLLDHTLEQVAVMALQAGGELLLLASGPHLPHVVSAIVSAVETGVLAENTLAKAARKVRSLAAELSKSSSGGRE
jgi:beta-N-acetylhexosaminidase